MRTIIFLLLMCIQITHSNAQKTQIFALSPMAKDIEKVNGVVAGIGHFEKKGQVKYINGVNVDLMVLSPIVVMMGGRNGSSRYMQRDTILIVKGLNIGIGGYFEGVVHKGLNIAMYNEGISMTGFSINGAYNSVNEFKGISIAGLANITVQSIGLNIAPFNMDVEMKGIQIGVLNKSMQVKGLQIGLINITDKMNGLQIGVFNKNSKRVLPFINF